MSANEKHSGGGGNSKIAKNMGKGCAKKFVERGKSMVCNEKNLVENVEGIESNKEVHAKKETKKRNFDNIAEKIPYDSSVHTLNPQGKLSSKTRYKKRDKRTDKKKKGLKKNTTTVNSTMT